MASIQPLIAAAKENRGIVAKILAEVLKMKGALEGRIAALEVLVAELGVTPEQLSELQAELDGARGDLAALDALNPDAEPPVEPPQA